MDIIDKDSASAAVDGTSAGGNVASVELFESMAKTVADNPGLVKEVNAVYLWNINKNKAPAAQWSKFFCFTQDSLCHINAVTISIIIIPVLLLSVNPSINI